MILLTFQDNSTVYQPFIVKQVVKIFIILLASRQTHTQYIYIYIYIKVYWSIHAIIRCLNLPEKSNVLRLGYYTYILSYFLIQIKFLINFFFLHIITIFQNIYFFFAFSTLATTFLSLFYLYLINIKVTSLQIATISKPSHSSSM